MSKYGVFSGPYFSVFGLNTRIYGPEKTPYLDIFHAANAFQACNIVRQDQYSVRFSINIALCKKVTKIGFVFRAKAIGRTFDCKKHDGSQDSNTRESGRHLSLGLTVENVKRSKIIVSLLNRFGHGASDDTIRRIDLG